MSNTPSPSIERTNQMAPIVVPPVDPEKVAAELHASAAAVREEIQRLQQARVVSPETMSRVITF